eukprot:SAG31_NODE_10139_length_1178_cov_9.705283_2_plen_67_part_00
MPQDITPEWLASETKHWLGTDYEDDYYRLVWDSEMQPGLAAAGQCNEVGVHSSTTGTGVPTGTRTG